MATSSLTYIGRRRYTREVSNARAFSALADPTRLAIVEELSSGERGVGELAEHFKLRQPTVSGHLKVLREAGLVQVRAEAQRRMYRVEPAGFRVIELWLERHRRIWAQHLDDLESHMDRNP